MSLQGEQLSARQSHQLGVASVAKTFSLPLWSVLGGGTVICVGLAFGLRALGRGVLGVPSDLPSLAASVLLAAAIFPVLGNCFGYFMSFRAKPSAYSMRLFLGIGTVMAFVGVAISASKLPASPSTASVAVTCTASLLPSVLIIGALLRFVPRSEQAA